MHLSQKRTIHPPNGQRSTRVAEPHIAKKWQFQRADAKKREADFEPRFAYTPRAYAGHRPKHGSWLIFIYF